MASNSVLLVEDETSLRALIGAVLRTRGFQVLAAATAAEALALWNRAGKSIPVALIDLGLAEGTKGEELARQISNENPQTKIILMSGQWPAEEQAQWPTDWSFLQKPFLPAELIKVVQDASR